MTQQPELPHVTQRHELAVALHGLREDARLSTTVLAERLRWSQSRVSRIDRGVTLPSPEDVDQWAQATNADPDIRRHLMDLADRAQLQLTTWRRELAPGRRRKQQEMAAHEAGASVIRLFGADVVPGLAQTRPYAAKMFQLGRDVTDEPDDLDAVLDARLARQHVLDSGKRVELLMSEFALHRHLVSGAEQRDQIRRLVELSTKPNVHVGVIPFDADERAHQYHGFAIYGDPAVDASAIVLVETLTRGLTIRAADEITQYIEHYQQLDSTALHDDGLRTFLQEMAAKATWS